MLNNIARIQRALTQAHLDAILLTDENDRRFATGFPSSDGAVIVTVHQAFFITDARYIEAARAALTGIAQVLLCSREAPMRTLVQGILREANVQILGGEEQTTSYAEFTAYEQLFGLKLQPAQNLIRNLRAAKQPEELAMMYQAQQITDEAFAQICTVIRPGMTEREIAAELIYRMLRLGAEGTSFDPIVLTGPDTSMPHGVPGKGRRDRRARGRRRTQGHQRRGLRGLLRSQLRPQSGSRHSRAPHRRPRRARETAGAHRHLRRAGHLSARKVWRAHRGCDASDG